MDLGGNLEWRCIARGIPEVSYGKRRSERGSRGREGWEEGAGRREQEGGEHMDLGANLQWRCIARGI